MKLLPSLSEKVGRESWCLCPGFHCQLQKVKGCWLRRWTQLSSSSSHTSHPKTPVPGDLRVHNGEELQLTTTITHVDGPTEIYKLTRKEAQE